jgi:hypothetical protein
MPDRDIVHGGVSHFFQRAYLQLCEGVLPSETLVHSTLEALTRSVRSYGDEPIKFLLAVGKQLDELPHEPLLREAIDWREQDRLINRGAQQVIGKKRAVALVERRARISLQELRRDGPKRNLESRLLRAYLRDVFEADFIERTPLADGRSVDERTFSARLAVIEPGVNEGIDKLVEQLAQKGTVAAIRTPRCVNPRERITLDTDLLKSSDLDGKDA